MNKKIKFFWIAGFFFTCILGTTLHFVYKWSGKNALVGLFAPVSESTWEHLKLLFFPAAVWTVLGNVPGREFFCKILPGCAKGICIGMLSVVIVFYTYTGIWGTNLLALDIITFGLGVFVTFWTADRQYRKREKCSKASARAAAAVLIGIMLLFFGFTYRAPGIGLFRAP